VKERGPGSRREEWTGSDGVGPALEPPSHSLGKRSYRRLARKTQQRKVREGLTLVGEFKGGFAHQIRP